MIKILICCLGGFSSSAMVKKIKSEIIENNLQKEMSVDFSPFMNANKLYHEYNVIMVCPHTRYEVNGFVKSIMILIFLFMYFHLKCMDR